jgi:hypothetical protein
MGKRLTPIAWLVWLAMGTWAMVGVESALGDVISPSTGSGSSTLDSLGMSSSAIASMGSSSSSINSLAGSSMSDPSSMSNNGDGSTQILLGSAGSSNSSSSSTFFFNGPNNVAQNCNCPPVPEPAAFWLLSGGFVLWGVGSRLRARRGRAVRQAA